MKRFLAFSIFCALSSQTHAEVSISIEHPISLSYLKKISDNLANAQNRDAKQFENPVFIPTWIQGKEAPMSIVCKAFQPKSNGIGCELNISPLAPTTRGEFSIVVTKPLHKSVLDATIATLQKKLKEVDPNTTDDHIHFGNPFNDLKNDPTHLYCQPSGTPPNKTWECFVYINEKP